MAVTHGHGNPHWNSDEVILALELFHQSGDVIPGPADERVIALSALLRSLPDHADAAKKSSFRNPAGVAFKLQNIRQVATGTGLANVSKTDRAVWEAFGEYPERTAELAAKLRIGLKLWDDIEQDEGEIEFKEGRLVTELHMKRERSRKLRRTIISRLKAKGPLKCELCLLQAGAVRDEFVASIFECHHLRPLGATGEGKTKSSDIALLCANCHRLIHKAIEFTGRWLTVQEAKATIYILN